MSNDQPSIWKRDLFETVPGRFVSNVVLPWVALIWGLHAILTKKALGTGSDSLPEIEAVQFGIGLVFWAAGSFIASWYKHNPDRGYRDVVSGICYLISLILLFKHFFLT